jgi:hypothetical protein
MAGLGPGVVDVLHGQIELIFVMFPGSAILGAPINQDPKQRDLVGLEERQDSGR